MREKLTTRQLDILRLLGKGYSIKHMSSTLNLAEVTVKKHATSVMKKLETNNRTQAALIANRLGLI